MPRHASADDPSFRRSLVRAFLGGVVAMVVTAVFTGVLANVGRDSAANSPMVVSGDNRSPSASRDVTRDDSGRLGNRSNPSKRAKRVSEPSGRTDGGNTGAQKPPRRHTTVQVLDAAGPGQAATEAAKALRKLGYDVIVINPAVRAYDVTTVLATVGHEAEARSLRALDDRFSRIRRNKNLNESVDLHVVVGADWPG